MQPVRVPQGLMGLWALGHHENSEHQAAALVPTYVLDLKERTVVEGHEEKEATEV